MNINDISQLIGTVGFPIVACIVMFKQNANMQKTLSDLAVTLQSMTEKLENISHEVETLKQ